MRDNTLLLILAIFSGISINAAFGGDEVKKARPVTLALLAKDFEFQGDWVLQTELHQTVLFATPGKIENPPVAAVLIPHAGKYRVWVAARDFPQDRPGTRTFQISISGNRLPTVFGKSGKENYVLEDGGTLDLPVGPALISIEHGKSFARFLGLILTENLQVAPAKPLTETAYPAAKLYPMHAVQEAEQAAEQLTIDQGEPQAVLANDRVRYEFRPAHRGQVSTLGISVKVKAGKEWREVDVDPAAERYSVVLGAADTKLGFSGFYPTWTRANPVPVTLEVGEARVKTISNRSTHSLPLAGMLTRFDPMSAAGGDGRVVVKFHPNPAGEMTATWELNADQPFATVDLAFTRATDGQASLGYELFFRRDLEKVNELLLPMMYQRKRLPEFDVTVLSNATPTPIALVESGGGSPTTLALVADPRDLPFEWPNGPSAPYAFSIRGPGATVQPGIWGSVLGTEAAVTIRGKPQHLRFKVLVQAGDWYGVFRTAVDQIFGVTDYRQNVRTSLSDAVLNMIDLYMDDSHGGWWERADAPYQIESKNGSTQSTPMLPLSLYRLTGDAEILRRRALPTMAFMLSRDGPHFCPVPEDPGGYPSGSMNGPVKLFGTATYGGLYELSARYTPALLEITSAIAQQPVVARSGGHQSAFDEYLARYQLTHDPKDLAKACELADAYISSAITTPPKKDLGPQPFFFISFVPDWEGLLYLYEATGKQSYLDAAAFGARQLMTGLWCQPAIPVGNTTVHPNGEFQDHPGFDWWKGPQRFRLGTPRTPNDTPAHEAPAWEVSNVGLGFEQPITYRASGAGRLIWQMGWSPHFLRLYRYTHDEAFLTCARNAVVGRWGNYPGYYVTTFTDLPQNPSYPLTGPDITDFYYHHIAPHMAWCIDYLVSEAEMLSDGAIAFPSLRQYGYAYFDSRIFGHAPGKIFDETDCWLLLRRGVVLVDNPQINTLLAWSEGKLHIILTNQSREEQPVVVTAGDKLGLDSTMPPTANLRHGHEAPVSLNWDAKARGVQFRIPARGLATLTLSGVKVDPPARPHLGPTGSTSETTVSIAGSPATVHAAALQVEPESWYAYIWSAASPGEARGAILHYQLDGHPQTIQKSEYPFEFLVPIPRRQSEVDFEFEHILPSGAVTKTRKATVRAAR